MSNEPLLVAPAHVYELAVKQGQAAAELTLASEVVSSVGSRIRTSHGVIAWSCASAIEAIQRARCTAARTLVQRSSTLSAGLASAADRYQTTDESSGTLLDRQIPVGAALPDRWPR